MDTAAAEDAAAAAAAPASTPSAPGVPASVCVHPLVLLSVVDHYHRVARDTRKRVVGCLLGEVSRGRVDVTNSFAGERRRERGRRGAPSRTKTNGEGGAPSIACRSRPPPLPPSPVPFEEDDKDAKIWFLDHSYLENMYAMFKKVNGAWEGGREKCRRTPDAAEPGARLCALSWTAPFSTSAPAVWAPRTSWGAPLGSGGICDRRDGLHACAARPRPLLKTRALSLSSKKTFSLVFSTARERIVGWYSTGPRLRPADTDIHDLVSGYVAGSGTEAVALLCEVAPKEQGLPVSAYAAVDEAPASGGGAAAGRPRRVFVNVPTEVGATEAEEVGVEHLLRDVKDAAASRLGADLAGVAAGVRGLGGRLRAVAGYAAAVAEGRLPPNHDLLADIQSALSLLPSLGGVAGVGGEGGVDEAMGGAGAAGAASSAALPPPTASLPAALSSRSTDMMLAVYAGAAVRAVLALHALVDNREAAQARERADAAVAAAKAGGSAGDGGAKKEGGKENEGEAKEGGGGDKKEAGAGAAKDSDKKA